MWLLLSQVVSIYRVAAAVRVRGSASVDRTAVMPSSRVAGVPTAGSAPAVLNVSV
jgi:hypothetical protein